MTLSPGSTDAGLHRRTTCRVCGGTRLRPVLSLGSMPLANAFLRSPEAFAAERCYPLEVSFCETCALLQLLDVVDPAVLFREYIYVTGTSETMAAHNDAYARRYVEMLQLEHDDLVVEVASNDGSLLRCFQRQGMRAVGVEPAGNLAALARESGVETIAEFFGGDVARDVCQRYGPARLVVANNVLAHVDTPREFLESCRKLISADGLVVVEVPYVRDLLDRLAYDTIYHEHLSYFGMTSLARLFTAAGLCIVRVERQPVHGGSLRVSAGTRQRFRQHVSQVDALIAAEQSAGLDTLAQYERFAADVEANRRAARSLLEELAAAAHSVAAYGAPAKGNTWLNYCGIDTRLVAYAVDKNPAKVGLYTPGMHLPVLPVSALLERQPHYTVILAWNFAEEIMRQQQEYRARGGRWILPIPRPSVFGGA